MGSGRTRAEGVRAAVGGFAASLPARNLPVGGGGHSPESPGWQCGAGWGPTQPSVDWPTGSESDRPGGLAVAATCGAPVSWPCSAGVHRPVRPPGVSSTLARLAVGWVRGKVAGIGPAAPPLVQTAVLARSLLWPGAGTRHGGCNREDERKSGGQGQEE